MYKSILLTLVVLTVVSCSSNPPEDKHTEKLDRSTIELKSPDDFFSFKKPKILVLGTFHFDYPNLDAHKVDEADMIDVLSDSGKKQMDELVDYIKTFKPTKIGIECFPNYGATNMLKEYIKGNHTLSRDEREQLGVRIASEMNLDTIYSLDAGSLFDDIISENPEFGSMLLEDYDFQSDDTLSKNASEWYSYNDKVFKEMTLLERLLVMNSKKHHEYDYGMYLIGDFKLGENRGADMLASYWYDRNLRIFRNIQKMNLTEDDRVLIIFGNSHAAILRQLITCSPEFEYVEFSELDKTLVN